MNLSAWQRACTSVQAKYQNETNNIMTLNRQSGHQHFKMGSATSSFACIFFYHKFHTKHSHMLLVLSSHVHLLVYNQQNLLLCSCNLYFTQHFGKQEAYLKCKTLSSFRPQSWNLVLMIGQQISGNFCTFSKGLHQSFSMPKGVHISAGQIQKRDQSSHQVGQKIGYQYFKMGSATPSFACTFSSTNSTPSTLTCCIYFLHMSIYLSTTNKT